MTMLINKQSKIYTPYMNTGTMLDLCTGKFNRGVGGKWVLDGGIPYCLGISGRSQTYKSNIAGSLLARALALHPNSEAIVYESENAISSEERYDVFVPIDKPVSSRIDFYQSTTHSLTDFYTLFSDLVNEKLKRSKEFMVETPFIDPYTNKPVRTMIPTFVLIDSFSRARSSLGDNQFDANKIDDSSMNTIWMAEGNIKTRIMHDLPTRAKKAGFYAILTAHIGDKKDMDIYHRTPKQLQYMSNTDQLKNVGSGFVLLANALLQTIKVEVLQTNDKKCYYPNKYSNDVEVNLIRTSSVRGKNNCSGNIFAFVSSQYQGILNEVTNFHFLKENKNYGLNVTGNSTSFSSMLTPDVTMRRTTIRQITENDYKVSRGLELLAQLCFIQRMWSTWKMPDYVNNPPEEFANKLINSGSAMIDRVLTSTGTWSTAKQEREMLTILDVLKLVYEGK